MEENIQKVMDFLRENSPEILLTHSGAGNERKIVGIYQSQVKPEKTIITFSDGVQTNVPSTLITN